MKTKYFGLLAVFGVLVLAASVLAAEPGSVTSVTTADKGSYTAPTPQSVDVTSGSVTEANLTAIMSTYRWAGVFGTVDGTIVLADSNNDQFYNWTGAKGVYVYASTGNSVDWANLADASETDVTGQFTWLSGTYADNYANTFTGTCNFDSTALGKTFSGTDCASPFSSGSTTWNVMSLKDVASPTSTDDIIWVAEVSEDGTAYNGQTVDYELLLPEDGTNGDSSSDTYYLWVELQ